MNKIEALKACLDGKKIRNKIWGVLPVIYFQYKNDIFCNSDGSLIDIDIMYHEGWEIHKETKTVRLWQFARADGLIAGRFYTEDQYSYWDEGELVAAPFRNKTWIKTSCYIDVEVKV